MPLKLTVYPADLPGRRLVLWEGGCYVLGRSPRADFVVPDPRVSNRHLLIDGREDTWRITEEGSKNGTRVDGRPLDSIELDASAWLNIGGVPAFAEAQSRQDTRADDEKRKEKRAAAVAAANSIGGRLAPRLLLTRCLEGVIRLSGCERAFVWTYDDSGKLGPLMLKGAARPSPSRRTIEAVAACGEYRVISDTAGAEAQFRHGSIERGGIRALVALPLESRGERLGALYADSLRPGKTFTELDLDLLLGLAAQAAVALGMCRLRGELNRLAFAPLEM